MFTRVVGWLRGRAFFVAAGRVGCRRAWSVKREVRRESEHRGAPRDDTRERGEGSCREIRGKSRELCRQNVNSNRAPFPFLPERLPMPCFCTAFRFVRRYEAG